MKKAFTLLELLTAVAIVAILAVVATPNFLESQTRAKVARLKADMHTIAAALESYQVDWNKYPYDGHHEEETPPPNIAAYGSNRYRLSKMITTPQAYLTTCRFHDPFQPYYTDPSFWQAGDIYYISVESTYGDDWDEWIEQIPPEKFPWFEAKTAEYGGWYLYSLGPDLLSGPYHWPGGTGHPDYPFPQGHLAHPYDPTNGSISPGDIFRSQRSPWGYADL